MLTYIICILIKVIMVCVKGLLTPKVSGLKTKNLCKNYSDKIPGLKGSMILHIMDTKICVIYCAVILFVLVIGVIVALYSGNDFIGMSCVIFLLIGVIGGVIVVAFSYKRLNVFYTNHYLILIDPKSYKQKKIQFSDIVSFSFKNKSLVFTDKYNTFISLNMSSSAPTGFSRFFEFLYENHYSILNLISENDKRLYNKHIEKYSYAYGREFLGCKL